QVADLAYRDYIEHELPRLEWIGELLADKLLYYTAVSREPFVHDGRLTTLLDSGRIAADLGIEALDPEHDRVMLCGSPPMLADFRAMLDARGFQASPRIGSPGSYVLER